TLFVFGSMRSTLPSFLQKTHTEPSPTATEKGSADTSMRWLTTLRSGSTLKTRFSDGHVTHNEVSPNATLLQPAPNRISATILFSAGSTRDRVVFSSVNSQTLSGETASPA